MLNKHLTGSLKSLKRILPWRRKNGGTNPKITGTMGPKLDGSPEEHWIFPTVELTELEKREEVARCVEIGMRMIFENFCYKFGGETLRQDGGGPLGARVTMAAARLVMQAWSEEYLTILRRSGLVVDILTGYVDDVRQVSTCLNLGMRYDEEQRKFLYNKEAEMEDLEKKKDGESNNQRMARVCLKAMNAVSKDLEFTVEVPEEFENGRLPTLDFSLWMMDGLLTHSYFQKSMKSPYVVMERSAMSYHKKMNIMSNEVTRRLSNVDHEKMGNEEIVKVLAADPRA